MAATDFETAVSQTITASNQLHDVINGSTTETVTTESGEIPSLRKSLTDNFFFLDPIDWVDGASSTKFNQLYKFTDGLLWYAPAATIANPIPLGASPTGDSNWLISPFSISAPVAPRAQDRQYGDGVNTTFDTPTTVYVNPTSMLARVDGIYQSSVVDYTVNNDGKLVFISGAPPQGSAIDITLYTPVIKAELTEEDLPKYTDIVYKSSGGNSVVENMVAGIPVEVGVGAVCQCENGSRFKRISTNGNMDDFKPLGDIFALDFGADINGIDSFSSSLLQMISIADTYNVEIDLGKEGLILADVVASADGVVIKGGSNLTLKGGTTTALTLNGDNNICRGFKVEDTGRNTQTLWLNGDNCLADSITAYNSIKSTSPTALFGDLIRISGNNSGARWCETYNGHTGIKLDNGDNPTERSYGQFLYQCRSHDNIRGGVVKPECADYNISQSYFNDNNVNEDQGSDGLLCERNSTGANITGCRFHRNGEHGLYGQFDNSIIDGNFANDNNGSGLKFGGKKNGNFNDSNPPISDAEFNANYVSENNKITNNICLRNGLKGSSNAGIYLQETHRGYTVSENDCHHNLYGIRAVNQGLGGEIDNLSLLSNYCLGNTVTDMTLSVKLECEIIGGNYGSITTFMNSDTFNDLTMKSLKVDVLTTSAVQTLKLRDVDITTQFTPSSANSISIGAGCTLHSSGDLNMRNVTEILSSTIIFDTNGSLTASSSAKLERMNDVTIEAYSNTSIPYNLGSSEPSNINFDSIRIKTGPTDIRAMVFNANGHEISGVKSDNNAGKDILQINGNDCSMSLCTSTVSKSARVTMGGSGNIAVNNQAEVLDATGNNDRFANRTQP